MKRQQPCSNPLHPRGEPGPITSETKRAEFRQRTCPVCGRPQGIARIPREPANG